MKEWLIKSCSSMFKAMLFNTLVKFPFHQFMSKISRKPESIDPNYPSDVDTQLCFLLGSARSGTTISSVLLNNADDIDAPPELYLATYDDLVQRKTLIDQTMFKSVQMGLGEGIAQLLGCSVGQAISMVREAEEKQMSVEDVYKYLCARSSSKVFVDKTPFYLAYVSDALFKQRFPKAKYIYIYRHPLSVIRSQKEALDGLYDDEEFKKTVKKGRELYLKGEIGAFVMPFARMEAFKEFQDYKLTIQTKHDFDKYKLLEEYWLYENKRTWEFLKTVPEENKCIFAFESLIESPREVMQKIYQFLEIDADPEMAVSRYENKKAPDTIPSILNAFWHSTIGDPNQIFLAGQFDASRAHTWKKHMDKWGILEPETRAFVAELGYEVPEDSAVTPESSTATDTATA